MSEKTYHFLRAFYTGRSEMAADLLTRIKADYQLNDSVTGQRLRIVKDSKGFPNGVCFVDALMDLVDGSVTYEK